LPEQSEKGSGYRSLQKALLLEVLDLLEQEFLAFQQRGGGVHRSAASAPATLALIDADVKRTQQLLLDLHLTATD
jgi:hypothetical protein